MAFFPFDSTPIKPQRSPRRPPVCCLPNKLCMSCSTMPRRLYPDDCPTHTACALTIQPFLQWFRPPDRRRSRFRQSLWDFSASLWDGAAEPIATCFWGCTTIPQVVLRSCATMGGPHGPSPVHSILCLIHTAAVGLHAILCRLWSAI